MKLSPTHLCRMFPCAFWFLTLTCTGVLAQGTANGPWALDSSRRVEVSNLGGGINTDKMEYAPTISFDGRTLYFASTRQGGKGQHDIWMAARGSAPDAGFEAPQNLAEPLNSKGDEGSIAVTADGRTFVVTACDRADGSGDCDLYEGTFVGTAIGRMRNFQEANSTHWDARPWISADGRTVLFVSNRLRQSQGALESDIFIIRKDEEDEWSEPVPLGPAINSPHRDDSPCLALDGKVLLFSSNRPGGMGGFDLYASRLQNDGQWGMPVNLGPLFNTEADERFVTATQDCSTIYFSSKREDLGAQGNLDILVGKVR